MRFKAALISKTFPIVDRSLLQSAGRADACDFGSRLLSWRTSGFPELGDQSAAGLGQTTKAVLNDPNFATSPHTAAAAHSASIPSNGGVMRTGPRAIRLESGFLPKFRRRFLSLVLLFLTLSFSPSHSHTLILSLSHS